LVYDVLEFYKYVSEATIIVILFAKYPIDYGQKVLDHTIREQLYTFEMQFSPFDVRQANPHVLLFLLLVCHFLVLLVDFWRDAVLLQGIYVLADAKEVGRALASIS
jgi:hypothetical protein